jgi:DNA-binding transcriptional LysR family regulator
MVADVGSFSQAARRLGITQPALSRQVRDLETELGVRLFDRVGRRARVSADGEALLAHGRRLLADTEALGERARALGRGEQGVLRVGATPQTLQSLLARFITRFRHARPGVELHLTEDGGIRLLTLVERGDLHLAVGAVPAEKPLRARRIFPYCVLAVTAESHRLGRRRTVELAELRDEPLLLLRRDFGSRATFDAACREAGVRPRSLFESGEPHSLLALAEQGHGVAVVPSTVLFDAWRVHVAPIVHAGHPLADAVAVAWDPRRVLPRYADAFVEELAASTRRSYPGRRFHRLRRAARGE